ncbi:MAG: YidC/Oxa1 family membrane protein insertase [Acidimicrobiales bacterium]
MFDAFFRAVAFLLAWFYELPVVGGSYAWAIALLTLTIMLLVTPLNVKATRSMMTMSAMAPEMKKIQQEFADDRQKMNEELLAFYRENKINPLGGCLPMLMQIPFFIVLYQVVRGITQRASEATVAANGVEVPEGGFVPKYLDQFPDTALYTDLAGDDSMLSWGIDLSRSAGDALQVSFGTGLPYMFLILVVAGSAFLQQKQMSVRNPNTEMPQQQKILLRMMPVFFGFISFNFAAGLVVYFLVSNLYRIFQNAAISMRLYDISGTQALLGIGTTNLATGAGRGDSGEPATDTDDKADKKPEKKPDKAEKKPDKAAPPPGKGKGGSTGDKGARGAGAKGSRASAKDAKQPGGARSNRNRGGAGSSNGKASRPPSGRVTPPKSAGGHATPPRRKKKRS